jgi:hypothetical protein
LWLRSDRNIYPTLWLIGYNKKIFGLLFVGGWLFILNFAERVLPRASDLWIQSSLEQRQRLQRLFFPEGVAFSGKAFDRTVVTSSLFEYLRPLDAPNKNVVDQTGAGWNQLATWLKGLDSLRQPS